MANPLERLRLLSASHRKRVSKAQRIAENMKKVADAGAAINREVGK